MTDSERRLWSRLRGKQILGVQFYRQKPLGIYIVDFYASIVKLVIEVDGSQHLSGNQAAKDKKRDKYLKDFGLNVFRFDSRQVLKETDFVLEVIYAAMEKLLMSNLKKSP